MTYILKISLTAIWRTKLRVSEGGQEARQGTVNALGKRRIVVDRDGRARLLHSRVTSRMCL